MKFLIIGDIVGRGARNILKTKLEGIIKENQIQFVIANGENASGGNGLSYKNAQELFSYGIDVITMGNHTWDQKEIYKYIDQEERIVRPSNYPSPCPGRGYTIIDKNNIKIAIYNLSGRVFLNSLDCPFKTFEKDYKNLKNLADIIILDFHGEATAEKKAMGWFVDGKVSLIFGTHTHVQTGDERILPNGTGYITDIGMTGPYNSVIGVDKDIVIERFLTQRPIRFEVAKGPIELNGIIVDINEENGKCENIQPYKQLYLQE
ncbi:MAG TPA: TIGR00282 family metallophosphoesterase [Eubacteriaceae bacterium]|jgi:metallophosphoesterase (TIGR00282 family)|nr:TIGR00282 family metallophosphoesterase [Eubacteriaceae bacterium]